MKRNKPVRFTESPLTVYDTVEWDPLEDFMDLEYSTESLDIDFVENLAKRTVETCAEYGVPVRTFLPAQRVEGEEVGDDRVDFTLNPLQAASVLICQEEVSRMVTSKRDTNLSTVLWNFCEVTSIVPLHPEQSFDRCRKVGNFEDLGFVDVPPLRIILDVSKGDRSHSSTAVGKATMLGSRLRTPRSEFLQVFHLASYLQDGCLRTSRSSEPKYLPQIMGGSGVRAPFGEPENLYLSVLAYRGGICERIYGSATRELRQALSSLEEGVARMPILCRRLRDKQEYLHGTYAEKIFVPTRTYKDSFGITLPPPLITASGGANMFTSFENRLVRTRHLITRSAAEREWENTTRIRASLLTRGKTTVATNAELNFKKKRARDEFGGALNANTALANLLNRKGSIEDVIRLTNDNFHVVNCGATHFTRWDSEWLFFGGKSENFTIEDLTSSEDMFLRTEVSEDETLRVGSIPLRPIIGKSKMVLTTTTIGLYQIGSGMYEWAENLTHRLVQSRARVDRPLTRDDALEEYKLDPEWVNDDTLLIARCLRETGGLTSRTQSVVLVSADKRLGNQMANTCNVTVIRLHPMDYISWAHRSSRPVLLEPSPEEISDLLSELRDYNRVRCIYIDTGSVNAYLSRIDADSTPGNLKLRIPRRAVLDPKSGKRTYQYIIEDSNIPKLPRLMIHRPVQRPKRFRTQSGLLGETRSRISSLSSRSLSATNWRRGE
jgi:hypothetical protein